MDSLHTHIFSNRFVRTSAVIAVFALVLLTSAILVPLYNKLDITEAATGTAKESSLSFNLTNSTASVDLSVNDANGTFATSSPDVEFNISTTNYTGYTLSIQANNNNQQLINGDNSNIKLNSISSTINYDTFNSDDNYNNTWGYLPSKYNSATNTSYLPAPTATATTLDTTSSANSSVNTYTIGIGARASYTTPAGEYTGTYILTAVGNTVSYSITFNKGNTNDTVSNLPSAQSSSGTSSTSITLSSTKPTRTGYTFTGWCMGTISTNTSTHVDSCTGTNSKTFSAGSSFGIDQTTSNITTLYAMWTRNNVTYTLNYNANNGTNVPSSQSNTNNTGSYTFTLNTTTIPTRSGYNFLGYATTSSATTPTYTYTAGTGTNGANGTFSPSTIILSQSSMSSTAESTTLYAVWEELTYMQGLSSDKCTTTASKVVDSRDGTTYTIQRLADGNCWLLDNLALDLTDSKVQANLTSATTNASNTALNYLKNGGGSTSDQWATSKVTVFENTNTNAAPDNPRIAKSGNCVAAANCVNSTNLTWSSTDSTATANNGKDAYPGIIGIYYNYCAATAGSYCYTTNTATGNAQYDICPYGWRLPTSNNSGEYKTLYASYNSDYTGFRNALQVPLSGNFFNGVAYAIGNGGDFWSSTRKSNENMYYLHINTSSINPVGGAERRYGFSIRCILSENISNITYMQQVNSNIFNKMTSNTTYTLKDARDSQDYTVAKLADGKLWMTKNLNLAGGTKLYSSDSDVPAGYDSTPYFTLPTSSITGFSNASTAYVYNSNSTTCNSSSPCYSYYSYIAATAGSGADVKANGFNASYSICPSGWRLPTSTTSNATPTANSNWTTGDWWKFTTAYGMSTKSYSTTNDATFYNRVNGDNAAGKSPTNFLLTGYCSGGSCGMLGTTGFYWSSTSGGPHTDGAFGAYYLYFNSKDVSSANGGNFRMNGVAVRCLFAG